MNEVRTVVYAKITKAGNAVVEFDYSKVNDQKYEMIIEAGVTTLLNTRMTKVTKALIPNEDDRKAAALAIAEENRDNLYEGTFTRTTKSTVTASASREEMTEALRLARLAVKDEIRRQGGKLSHYNVTDITTEAKKIVKGNPSFMAQAKTNLSTLVRAPSPIVLHEDPKKVKAEAERKAKVAKEKAEQLSAKQAGAIHVKAKAPVTVEAVH